MAELFHLTFCELSKEESWSEIIEYGIGSLIMPGFIREQHDRFLF